MNVLCIWWGYCSGAALFRDDEKGMPCLVAASSEERFLRVKNTSKFPNWTISWLKTLLPKGGRFDKIVYVSNDVGVDYLLAEKGDWSVEDYVKENLEYWSRVLLQGEKIDYLQYIDKKLDVDIWPGKEFWSSIGVRTGISTTEINSNFSKKVPSLLANEFSLPLDSVERIDHHVSHRQYAIWTDPQPPEKQLVFTIDGWGDGRNATVSLVTRNAHTVDEEEIFSSENCSLARVYRFITLLLGMKPSEHEFKVMGLAPYGKKKYVERSLEIFRRSMHFCLEKQDFVQNKEIKDSYFTFRDLLISERFDNIAAGLQIWLEETLADWVTHFVQKTGINNVAFSGGVAMNCKAMMRIAELDIIANLHVPPSAGDESHILGAYYSCMKGAQNSERTFSKIPYFGYANTATDLDECKSLAFESGLLVSDIDTQLISEVLLKGGIVAVSRGQGEFGARSLGNRSFLIDASRLDAKEKLNIAVKNRDFWMPFAPVMIDKFAPVYLKDFNKQAHKNNRFMTTIFQTTERGRQDMLSAVHPADGTCRAQILSEDDNTMLYRLIETYAENTGRGALLNTSFNTHGFPIVNSAKDALSVFVNTPTDLLVLDSFMISKNV